MELSAIAELLVVNRHDLSQRDRAAWWVSYGHKWKTVNGRQYFTDIIGLSSTTMTQLASKAIEFGEITPLKVIEVGTMESPYATFY